MKAGITGFGYSVPRFRIRVSEIAKAWGKKHESFQGVVSKAVASGDEDSTTLGFEAARLAVGDFPASKIGAIYFGSESKAYSVKPTCEIIASFLGLSPNHLSADLEFACKAGTSGLQAALAAVEAGLAESAIAIGADCAQSRPGDILEFSAGCGAAAFLVGRAGIIASVEATRSYSTDIPDFWRGAGEKYPTHTGRFTGEPGYFHHTVSAARGILGETGLRPEDFDHVVFHQPNAQFPKKAARKLGFSGEQLEAGLFAGTLGNVYSAGTLLGLAKVLEVAERGARILAVSYGSGAGSDAFVLRVERSGLGAQPGQEPVFVDYGRYLVMRGKV